MYTSNIDKPHKHIVDIKEPSEYQKMLNQWETIEVRFSIISEERTPEGNIAYHIIRNK